MNLDHDVVVDVGSPDSKSLNQRPAQLISNTMNVALPVSVETQSDVVLCNLHGSHISPDGTWEQHADFPVAQVHGVA